MPVKRRLSKVREFHVTPTAVRRWREVGRAGLGPVTIDDDELAEALGLLPLIAYGNEAIDRLAAELDAAAGGNDAG